MFDRIDAFNPELIVMNSGIFLSEERRDKSSPIRRKAEPRAGQWPPSQPAHTWDLGPGPLQLAAAEEILSQAAV